jgi:phosphomannomutase
VDRLEQLRAAALAWRAVDPDHATRAQTDDLLARGDPAELEEHFGRRLGFGTAGIRGPLGPGPGRMNVAQAQQVAVGLATHVLRSEPDARRRGVVVARDARHGSADLAAEVVRVLRAHGLVVHLFDEPVPTPLAVATVRQVGAAAGVVVTASHNPAADNGVKVVWSDGAQIVPPVDEDISSAMAPLDEAAGRIAGRAAARVRHLGGATGDHPAVAMYLERAASLVPPRPACALRVTTTALHGVGGALLERVLRATGHEDLHPVAAQQEPDPDFPTVALPNPEEPGTLDLLLALAEEVRADVALALDPDADRLAVAVLTREGAWRVLTGDEVGALLLWHLLRRTAGVADRLVATTLVSSQLAAAMCRAERVHFRATLTGFKWLCRPGIEHPEWHQVLLYEEALGYAVGPDARDKDGITAALVVLDLLAELAAAGRSPFDVLDDLARRFGVHVTVAGSWPVREELAALPDRLGGVEVVSRDRPAPDVWRGVLADGTRVVVRPSGTEPKVKCYCEAVGQVGADEDPETVRSVLRRRLSGVVADLAAQLAG